MRPGKGKREMPIPKVPKSTWFFNWQGGGYNTVQASSKKEAVAAAVAFAASCTGVTKLVPVESSFKVVSDAELAKIDREYASLFD